MACPDNAHTYQYNNETVSLTFTEKPNIKHKTQKQLKPKIVSTCHYMYYMYRDILDFLSKCSNKKKNFQTA